MNLTSTADLHAPLPARQFRRFLLFFHTAFVFGTVIALVARLHNGPPSHYVLLTFLVLVQILLYLVFFAIPSVTDWPAFNWFRSILGRLDAPPSPEHTRWATRWWWTYIGVSVLVVLAEARIDRAFGVLLIAYVGQISALPLRQCVPATFVMFVGYLLAGFGWNQITSWDAGDWISLLITATPILALVLFLGRITVTSGERGQLIVRLEAAQRELELARQHDAELAALRERERLARDLHDSLGHSLVTLTVQLEAAQRLVRTDPTQASMLLQEMQRLTRASMNELRCSLAGLRAPLLGERSLADALRTLCADSSRRGSVSIDCQVADGADNLPPLVSQELWRIAQEALVNVEKHAHARHCQIELTKQPKEVQLRVSDDGLGAPEHAVSSPGHYGLRGMRERAEGLGGTFALKRTAERGTVIEVTVPVLS